MTKEVPPRVSETLTPRHLIVVPDPYRYSYFSRPFETVGKGRPVRLVELPLRPCLSLLRRLEDPSVDQIVGFSKNQELSFQQATTWRDPDCSEGIREPF